MSNVWDRSLKKVLRRIAVVVAVATSLTCNDSLFEPGMEVAASFDVQQLLESAESASIPIDSLVIELRRVSDSTLAHAFAIDVDSITISEDGTVSADVRIPLQSRTEEFYLSPENMAVELSNYPRGTVSYVYMTSDGGLNLENSFMALVKMLPEHVQLVSGDAAVRLALEASSNLDDSE